jgi:hypothetical protein
MSRISSQKKLKDVDRLLSEVKAKIKELKKGEAIPYEKVAPRAKAATKIADRTVKHRKRAIQGIDLKAEYEELYQGFVSGKNDTIRDYIMGRDKEFLKEFCRVNNLPVDAARASKHIILEQVMLWMSRRKAISKTLP